VDLEPGLDTEVRADILTNADIRHLQKAASGNESGQSVAVSALRFAPAGDQAHVDAYYGGEALWLQNRDYLRYGPGIAGGQGGDSRAVEAFVHGRLQLNRMGAAGIPPHIGPVAILPFAAVDLGLGYHEAGGEDQFADADAPWYREALRNHLVARARGGFEFSFHRSFSVTLHGGKHFLMDRAWTAGIGGTINLPSN
jgi:hypothetical protein